MNERHGGLRSKEAGDGWRQHAARFTVPSFLHRLFVLVPPFSTFFSNPFLLSTLVVFFPSVV